MSAGSSRPKDPRVGPQPYVHFIAVVLVIRVLEPIVRALPSYTGPRTAPVLVVIGSSALYNLLSLGRLIRGCLGNKSPASRTKWYVEQVCYGIAVIVLAALVLPADEFVPASEVAVRTGHSVLDSLSLQFYLSLAIAGLANRAWLAAVGCLGGTVALMLAMRIDGIHNNEFLLTWIALAVAIAIAAQLGGWALRDVRDIGLKSMADTGPAVELASNALRAAAGRDSHPAARVTPMRANKLTRRWRSDFIAAFHESATEAGVSATVDVHDPHAFATLGVGAKIYLIGVARLFIALARHPQSEFDAKSLRLDIYVDGVNLHAHAEFPELDLARCEPALHLLAHLRAVTAGTFDLSGGSCGFHYADASVEHQRLPDPRNEEELVRIGFGLAS